MGGRKGMTKRIHGPLDIAKYALKLRFRPEKLTEICHCANCGANSTERNANFCTVCKSRTLIAGKVTEMYYKKIQLNENGKAVTCPHCSNEEPTPGDYCMICGSEIINHCADMHDPSEVKVVSKGCRTVLPGNARYCYKCGNESTFYQKGWLKDWRSENTRKAIENINVAVDFDDLKPNRTLG